MGFQKAGFMPELHSGFENCSGIKNGQEPNYLFDRETDLTAKKKLMYTIAPQIFRKRLLLEGFFKAEVNEQSIVDFFKFITSSLQLKTYGDPIVHATSGVGKESNQGYDAFVPLIDSGIYLAVWSNQKFLSLVMYTCKDFDEGKAVRFTNDFFSVTDFEHKLF
jgi:S-adenosylmethionine decarboxylase